MNDQRRGLQPALNPPEIRDALRALPASGAGHRKSGPILAYQVAAITAYPASFG
jgi:hypothetical protein